MVRLASFQVRAPPPLTKIEDILPEQTVAISDGVGFRPCATCTHHSPTVSRIGASVPEEHPRVTTTLKHLQFHHVPAGTKLPGGLPIPPAMQAIVVDRVSIVDPELAAIIREDTEAVMTCPEDSHSACPTHSEVITSTETAPFLTCVAIVHIMAPTSHVWLATVQVLAPTSLTKVEGVLHEETVAVSGAMGNLSHATCTNHSPTVCRIGTLVPEEHPSVSTTLKHLKSHNMPTGGEGLGGFSISPTMQAIIVDRVTVVNPKLAPIIGEDAESVLSCFENSHSACPSHSEVITPCETTPFPTCVAIVHGMFPTCMVSAAPVQVRALFTLTEVEDVLPEETVAIGLLYNSRSHATCTHNSPSVSSIGAIVPE